MAMHGCDVLIAVGARFDDRVTGEVEKFSPNACIIHIDIDAASISKTVAVDIPIVGNVRSVLKTMLSEISTAGWKPHGSALEQWWQQIERWRSTDCLQFDESNSVIKPQHALQTLWQVTNGDAYITSDVGQHQMWAAQFYSFDKPRRWINSGGLGTMGFGLPAAIGVQLAFPESVVACVTGDASIQMCIQELSTCMQYNLPIKIINLNNRYMGMVRQWQEFGYQKRYSQTYLEALPDFVKLAESYGHIGISIDSPDQLEATMQEAFSIHDRLVFLNIITDQTENVYPMIESNKGHNDMRLHPKHKARVENSSKQVDTDLKPNAIPL